MAERAESARIRLGIPVSLPCGAGDGIPFTLQRRETAMPSRRSTPRKGPFTRGVIGVLGVVLLFFVGSVMVASHVRERFGVDLSVCL